MSIDSKMRDGMMGLIVGDALGVPVEFHSRRELAQDPVIGMREYGTHNQPAGTWSDDSSLALATLDALVTQEGMRGYAIMDRFVHWLKDGDYTPDGRVFDVGGTTQAAIRRYTQGREAIECGGKSERDNGNGSLMRILPACVYFVENDEEDPIEKIHEVSALTHGHKRSLIGCGLFYTIAREIMHKSPFLTGRVQAGINNGRDYYNIPEYAAELEHYHRLWDIETFAKLPESEIKSGGYVVNTLEAAIWCLLNTGSYRDCVLAAVNLGDDTDTTAAVAGGLAGLWYGYDAIPQEWRDTIRGRDIIDRLCK
ncbi:MAG: ADP-ribosylglycohydrolase family protein [Eubacteriaceae bacterium]|nr:ADP-ribosylglycohydrolase family protein [Eubacteriaceae bacterium]